MSKNILLAEIQTEIEKIKNLTNSGELDDVRRSRIAGHGEQLEELQKQLKNETVKESEITERFNDLRESLKTI